MGPGVYTQNLPKLISRIFCPLETLIKVRIGLHLITTIKDLIGQKIICTLVPIAMVRGGSLVFAALFGFCHGTENFFRGHQLIMASPETERHYDILKQLDDNLPEDVIDFWYVIMISTHSVEISGFFCH